MSYVFRSALGRFHGAVMATIDFNRWQSIFMSFCFILSNTARLAPFPYGAKARRMPAMIAQAGLACAAKFVEGGLRGPPPPLVQFGLKCLVPTCGWSYTVTQFIHSYIDYHHLLAEECVHTHDSCIWVPTWTKTCSISSFESQKGVK